MQCPDCSGEMWDNRQSKRSPKQPDFKCKDKTCNKAVWENNRTGQPNRPANGAEPKGRVTWPALHLAFENCHKIAKKVYGENAPAEVLHAGTATLLIAAQQSGLTQARKKPAPPPPPPPPPPEEPSDSYDDEDDTLPF